jgi:hypothetical protein
LGPGFRSDSIQLPDLHGAFAYATTYTYGGAYTHTHANTKPYTGGVLF